METIQTITLTATNFKIPATVHAVQNDTGRLLRMIVADTELPVDATAELAVKRSDGSYYNISCELEAEYNSFLADLTQALTQPGDTECQLKVDGLVSSYMFVVSVQADVSGVSVPQMGVYPQTLLDAADQIMYAQNDVKLALLQLAEKVAYVDADGQQYYDDLYNALYPPVRATSVVLSQNSLLFETVGLTKTLTATVLPAETSEKVVWGTSDPSVCTVANGVVTSVGDGNCVITATAGMVSASCNVLVSSVELVGITAEYTQSGTVKEASDIDALKEDLVVTAEWSDGTETVLEDEDYTLSGELTQATSTITVSYGNETTTFTVTVTLDQWTWVYNPTTDGKLSEQSYVYLSTQANASESVVDGKLHIEVQQAASSLTQSSYQLRLSDGSGTYNTPSVGHLRTKFKASSLSYASSNQFTPIRFQLSQGGTRGAKFVVDVTGGAYSLAHYEDASTLVIDKPFLLNEWYVVDIILRQDDYTILINGETAYEGSKWNTNTITYNGFYSINLGKTGTTSSTVLDIEYIKYLKGGIN